MLYCKLLFLLLISGSCSTAIGSDVNDTVITNNVTAKCAGKTDASGEFCDPSACQQLNVSCPLILNVLCASDECGCRLAFTIVFDHLGRDGRKDVTELCQATAAIKASTNIMDGLLSGAPDKRSIVAENPQILFLLFKGLNTLSIDMLKRIKGTYEALYSQQPAFDSYQRVLFYTTMQSVFDKRRDSDLDQRSVANKHNSSTDLTELARRESAIDRWITKQEKVVMTEDIPTVQVLSLSTRTPSRKYALDRDGHIAASRWPVYRNIILGILEGKTDAAAVDSQFFSPDSRRKLWDIRALLSRLIADETIAARQAQTKIPAASAEASQPETNTTDSRPFKAVSNQTLRSQYDFNSFAPLFIGKSDLLDLQKICDLFNHAVQIAALATDLYNTMFDEASGPLSDLERANYIEDWNMADDLTEGCF